MIVLWVLMLELVHGQLSAHRMSKQAHCPNWQCHMKEKEDNAKKNVFLQLMEHTEEPSQPLTVVTTAERPVNDKVHDKDPETGISLYNLHFKPGHFTCSKCDTGACPSCNTVCDLSSCMGEFYTQECWCRKDSQVELHTPMWWFREYDARFLLHDTVKRTFCDNDCTGGICDMDGLQCKKREEACRPWWWCNSDPPKEEKEDAWTITGFEYTKSLTFLEEHEEKNEEHILATARETFMQKSSSEAAVRRSGAESMSSSHSAVGAGAAGKAGKDELSFEANDFGVYEYNQGSWECGLGGLPPKVQDANSFLWIDRGYIVFDTVSCKGGAYDTECYCWDNIKYLKGEDPMTSELMCDSGCGLGVCAGNTCGPEPPPPPPPPPPPVILDPVASEESRQSELAKTNNKMDPLTTG